ncbi:MAG TPA: hypothetical protein VGE29_18325 [Prosthecobacter sp.]
MHSVPKQLSPRSWQQDLKRAIEDVIETKGQVILCVTGKSGAGKSTLGKVIRKKGLPGFPPRKIGVIDDGVLAVPLLGIFTRRIKSKTRERDNLAPFQHFLSRKKLVVYVNTKPELRLERCDIVLRLQLPEKVRQQRLVHRDKDGEARFRRTLNASDEVGIPADHVFDLCLDEAHHRAPQPGTQPAFATLTFLANAAPQVMNWMSCAAESC